MQGSCEARGGTRQWRAAEEQVGRLDVAVRDGLGQLVQVCQPLAQLAARHALRAWITQRAAPHALLQRLVAEAHDLGCGTRRGRGGCVRMRALTPYTQHAAHMYLSSPPVACTTAQPRTM